MKDPKIADSSQFFTECIPKKLKTITTILQTSTTTCLKEITLNSTLTQNISLTYHIIRASANTDNSHLNKIIMPYSLRSSRIGKTFQLKTI